MKITMETKHPNPTMEKLVIELAHPFALTEIELSVLVSHYARVVLTNLWERETSEIDPEIEEQMRDSIHRMAEIGEFISEECFNTTLGGACIEFSDDKEPEAWGIFYRAHDLPTGLVPREAREAAHINTLDPYL